MPTEPDWSSPDFDYLQTYIALLLDPNQSFVGGREWAIAEAQRWRDRRPALIASIRRSCGDPKWDPRGATVTHLRTRKGTK